LFLPQTLLQWFHPLRLHPKLSSTVPVSDRRSCKEHILVHVRTLLESPFLTFHVYAVKGDNGGVKPELAQVWSSLTFLLHYVSSPIDLFHFHCNQRRELSHQMSSQTSSASARHSHDQMSKATSALNRSDRSARPASPCQSAVSAATTHPTQPTALVGQQIVPKLKPCLKTPTKRFPEFEGWSSPPTDE
jgi:hypothetical protein